MITLAITVGDINGIGPEIALKAVHARQRPRETRFVLIGDASILHEISRGLGLSTLASWVPGDPWPGRRSAVVWSPASTDSRLRRSPGKIMASASKAAMDWIRCAVDGCMAGTFDGVVTAPICKEGLMKAGIAFPGHTEYLAELTGTKRYAMMLMGDVLRVILVTRHVPLAQVSEQLTRASIRAAVELASEAMVWLGLPNGTIGVCGLNPHAGDGGVLGGEERHTIAPAVRASKKRGIRVEGPVPADVIFYQALQKRYQAVVAMYHDQGLGPLKMISFDDGINVTLGLPIVRTSPDHGTAFDIAGSNRANPSSMQAAVKLAARLARQENPWR